MKVEWTEQERLQEFTAYVVSAWPQLKRSAFFVCGDWHRSEDIVQIALVKVYQRWDRLEREGSREAYVKRAVVNAAIDHLRARHRILRRERTTDSVPEAAIAELADDGLGDALLRAMEGLAPRQRAVLVLRFAEDQSTEETARILGISAGTVKSQSARGLEALRQELIPGQRGEGCS